MLLSKTISNKQYSQQPIDRVLIKSLRNTLVQGRVSRPNSPPQFSALGIPQQQNQVVSDGYYTPLESQVI